MKRALVLFLALAMLLPAVFLQPAKAAVTKEPFYVLNWEKVDKGNYDNIYLAPLFWTAASVDYKVSWSGASSFADLAKKTKELFDTRPEGTRFINFGFPPRIYLSDHVENYVYMDEGLDMLWTWFSQFLSAFSSIGGELDGVILDTEISKMNAANLQSLSIYRDIVEDPRYATEIRPLLEERGFPFYNAPDTPEISSIHNSLTGEKFDEARAIWDQVMQIRVADYLDEGVCQLLWEYYPDALVSDYQSSDRDGWYKFLSSSGTPLNAGVNAVKVGNTSNYNAYNTRPGSGFYKDADGNSLYNTPYAYNGAIYGESAFHMALWDVNTFKNIYASTDNKTISAWVRSYNAGNKPLAYSAYATEVIYHIGMLNPQPFLGHVIESNATDVPYYERLDVLSQQIHELSRVAGYSDRKPIEVPANWNDGFILSGMYANGRNIWRITPDTDKVSLEAFKTSAKDPTFTVGGKTVTFPGGTIIADTPIDAVGSCGYWVETAANVTPVVTADKDRYETYPALSLDFNDCQAGPFNAETCSPLGAWEFSGSAANIVAVSGNNVLALEGDATVNSVKLPGNITAGDSYAKNQTWEITVTIPESQNGTIRLLCYAGTDQAKDDGGFKIENGKVYYSKNGEYAELGKVSPGTYTFRRTLDLTDAQAFTSGYYVLSQGSVLYQAADVPVPAFTAITSIGFTAKQVTKAVHLDDFRITVAGSRAADFTLFDALTGITVKDPNAQRSEATAYRLSWLNASGKTETAQVQALIYEDGKLQETKTLKAVTMEPGCDGVEAGVVEVAAGQTLKVKLVTSYMAPETDPEPEPTAAPTTEPTAAPTGNRPSIVPTIIKPIKVTTAPTTAPTAATQATEVTQATEITEITEVTEATRETEATEAATQPTKEAEKDKVTQPTQAAEKDDSQNEKKPNTILIVVIGVVVLAAAGVGAYFLIKKKK